jgi:hypothetical protein
MSSAISWLTKLQEALDLSKKENKPILLDFFNPQ